MTFNEKVAYRKAYERDPRLPRLADKILAKQYVTEILGPEWVNPSLWSGEKLPPRAQRNWPIPYVLKANNACGCNYFVRNEAEQDWDLIEKSVQDWLYGIYGVDYGEWLYSEIKPGLLVEPFLGNGVEVPADYKLWVFGGHTKYIQVDLGRFDDHRQYFYDTQWNRQNITYICPFAEGEVQRPKSLERLIETANLLAAPFKFMRMDFYEVDERPIFGEFTFYPDAGHTPFKPDEVELELGQLWPD